jgi:hypothetical protein
MLIYCFLDGRVQFQSKGHIMRHFISLLLVFLLTSCASTTNYYPQAANSWRGGNAQNLISRWGQPDQKVLQRDGSYYLVYKTNSSRASSAPDFPGVGVSYNQNGRPVITTMTPATNGLNRGASTISCIAIFEVNRKNTITSVTFKGPSCYGNERFAQNMSNGNALRG